MVDVNLHDSYNAIIGCGCHLNQACQKPRWKRERKPCKTEMTKSVRSMEPKVQ